MSRRGRAPAGPPIEAPPGQTPPEDTPLRDTPLWDTVVGQAAALSRLARAVASDRVAHAYAFVGPPGVGRRRAALGLAQALLCAHGGCGGCGPCRWVGAGQHPDCRVLVPSSPKDNPRGAAVFRIEQVREIEHGAALAPLVGPRKVFVLDDAERLTLPAAQALLKLLEEPPPRTVLILIVAGVRALPATVLSRCQIVRFRPLGTADTVAVLEAHGTAPEAARLRARLCRGQVGLALGAELAALGERRGQALELAGTPVAALAGRLDRATPDRPTAAAYLETYWLWYRDVLCLAAGGDPALLVNLDLRTELEGLARGRSPVQLAAAIAVIKEGWLALEGNVNPRMVLERTLMALDALGASPAAAAARA